MVVKGLRIVLNARSVYWHCLSSVLTGQELLEVSLSRREKVSDGEPDFNSDSFAVFEIKQEDVVVGGDDLVDKA